MIYQVNMEKFSVEHQAESWLCWAATVKAVANYKGLGCPDQQGLGAMCKGKATGNNPSAVLEQRYKLKASNLIDWGTRPSAAEVEVSKQDLRNNLKFNLSSASGPLLCGLTEANDTAYLADPARPSLR